MRKKSPGKCVASEKLHGIDRFRYICIVYINGPVLCVQKLCQNQLLSFRVVFAGTIVFAVVTAFNWTFLRLRKFTKRE